MEVPMAVVVAIFTGKNIDFRNYLAEQKLNEFCPHCGRPLEISVDRVGGKGLQTSLACPGRKRIDNFCGYGHAIE